MGQSDPRRYVKELEELERCTARLEEASLREWPKLQHVASTVCEWADRAAVILFESGVFPEYAPLAMMIGPGDLSTRPIGWSIFLWQILCGTNNRGGYHVGKAVKDAEGRLIGANGKSGKAARVSNLGRIDTYDEVDAIEHWQRRAADYADVCRTLADKITGPGGTVADEPLTDTEQRVFDAIIAADGPIMGTAICQKTGIEQSTLTGHIIPVLKAKRGVRNRRGAGYYLPPM